jgi:hypothetical protein
MSTIRNQLWNLELVERIAGILWRLCRVPFFEVAILDARHAEVWEGGEPEPEEDEAEELSDWKQSVRCALNLTRDCAYGDALGKLVRQETTLMNAFTKTLQMLLLLQVIRETKPVILEAV